MSAASVDALVVLELLAAGTPLSTVLERLSSDREGAGVDDIARLDALAAAATELAAARDADRRRLRGMAFLSDTVADLAALLELDAVLQAICDRSRVLLGTDVAYLTLRDDRRGDTYVRASAGVVSEGFRAMRLDAGVGLGGVVAECGLSAVTVDYASDERFAHSRHVDHLVEAEGLRAIVGVPLRRGQQVLGVLFSAARTRRPFAPDDVVLFESLALHAAVAIENARLFERARASLSELEHTGSELRRRSAEAERAAALHARLAALVAEGEAAEELVTEIARHVGGTLDLLGPDDSATPEAAFDVAVGGEPARLRWWPPPSSAEAQAFGAELVRRGAVVVAGQLVAQRARSDADHRRRAAFVATLLAGEAPDERVLQRDAARLGLLLAEPMILLVVADDEEGSDRWRELRIADNAAREGGAAGAVGRDTVIVLPGGDIEAVAARWEPVLRGALPEAPATGLGASASGVAALRAAYGEARDALGLHRALGHDHGLTQSGDFPLFSLVFGGEARPDGVTRFIDQVLGPALKHDAARAEPVIVPFLEAYFAEGMHAANTAKRLGIHVNTAYQRLERVAALVGRRWSSPDGRLEVQFAVRARALARDVGAHEGVRPRREGGARADARSRDA